MADRFGASSLTAILAVAGMVGLAVVGLRAFNGSPADVELDPAGDVCLLLGEEAAATEARGCCSSHAKSEEKTECADVDKDCGEKTSCHHNGGEAEDCDHSNGAAESCHHEEKASCGDKADANDRNDGCCADKDGCEDKADCAEKCEATKEACSDKAEKPRTCCSQNN